MFMGEKTYGEKVVGIDFNPSGDPTVHQLKTLFAKIVDICDAERAKAGPGEKAGVLTEAISHTLTAQMWTVKGVTWKNEM